jgi:D-arabinose 5-phosphate isomerase GutQ
MADSNFVVKNGLTVNNSFIANSTVVNAAAVNATSVNTATANVTTSIVVGANLTVNTTALFVGNSSVNTRISAATITLNGVNVNTAITGNAATSYSNATSYADSVAATSYSNAVSNAAAIYQTMAGLSANVATLTANSASFVGSLSAANVVSNAQLSANLANYQTTAGLTANVATRTANNTSFFDGQGASFYTNITARLGYTPVNRAGDTSMTGSYTTTGAEIAIGSGQNEQKRLRLQNANRGVFFYLDNTTLGLWDVNASANRWLTDASGNFTAIGNVIAYSDIKLKTNIHTIEDALHKVSQLRGVTYDRKSDGVPQIGVIAQEVKEVVPEVVIEDESGVLGVAYGNMVGLLLEAVKELKAKVEELENKVK